MDWQVACRRGSSGPFELQPIDAFAQRSALKAGALANRSSTQPPPLATLQAALPGAVAAMRAHMLAAQARFAQHNAERLQDTLADLQGLQGRQIQQLELRLDKQIETVKRARFERRSQHIHRVFDDYRQRVQDTLTTEPQPWIQLAAAL